MAKVGRKEPTTLQTEVNTEEEWRQLLTRKGLVLADIYSEWSGPCTAMVSTLRQIKMEIGGETISYAVVRNDEIGDLERFRGSSEPVWMFIQDGKLVNLMFGAHCPNLKKLLVDEIKRVQEEDEPRFVLDVDTRSPEEEARWQKEEAVRIAIEERERAKEEAERQEKYEAFLAQMMFELCEETCLVLYPWVFKDENGKPREKHQSPQYTDLVHDLFKQNFDVLEEVRLHLTEELIERMLVESNLEITRELVAGLTDGKCMAMRLKGRRPHPDWPVAYPYESPDGSKKSPVRAIDDVENYLWHFVSSATPLRPEGSVPVIQDVSYLEKHVHVHEPDPEDEEDFPRVDPAVWIPPQARSKVHAFKTLFGNYMDMVHPYEEPVPPPSLCGFKFVAERFPAVAESYAINREAIENFGAFEFDRPPYGRRVASTPEDFDRKVKHKTGNEVFVVIVRRVNEEAFLLFAGIEPYFVTENDQEAQAMAELYFPEGVQDAVLEEPDDEEEFYAEEEQFEEYAEQGDNDEEDVDVFALY